LSALARFVPGETSGNALPDDSARVELVWTIQHGGTLCGEKRLGESYGVLARFCGGVLWASGVVLWKTKTTPVKGRFQ